MDSNDPAKAKRPSVTTIVGVAALVLGVLFVAFIVYIFWALASWQ